MNYLLTGTTSSSLSYRPLVQDDFDQWLPFFHHHEAVKLYPFPTESTAEELCQQWLDRQFLRYKENTGGFNALIDQSSGVMVGHCGLLVQEIDKVQELEIGYALLPEYWGKGYAIEAAKHCKDWAFKNGWADSLISIIHPDNRASIRVAERNGMKYEKNSEFKGIQIGIWRVNNF